MKILVLTTQRLDDFSGINTYLRELAAAAKAADRSLKVVSIREVSFFQLWKEIGAAGWVHLNTADPYSLILAKLRGKRVLARFHYPTWASTHTEEWAPWGFRKRLWGEISDRWQQFGGFTPRRLLAYASFMRRLFARTVVGFAADEISGVSINLSRSLELPRKIYTIYYPFALRPVPAPDAASGRVLLFCGRIDRGKGLLELIDALGVLARAGVKVCLRVAGDGPARPEAEERARLQGVDGAITWLGRIASERVHAEMASALAVAVPSITNDPSPFTVLEAGACRVPVIGSCKGGIPEEIGAGGWIIAPGDPDGFAAAIREAWDSPEECRRRGQLLHEHVMAQFAPQRSFRALCAVMEDKPAAVALGAIAHEGRW